MNQLENFGININKPRYSPANNYIIKAYRYYGRITGGPFPRFSAPGVDCFELFYEKGNKPTGTSKMRILKKQIWSLFQWMNDYQEQKSTTRFPISF